MAHPRRRCQLAIRQHVCSTLPKLVSQAIIDHASSGLYSQEISSIDADTTNGARTPYSFSCDDTPRVYLQSVWTLRNCFWNRFFACCRGCIIPFACNQFRCVSFTRSQAAFVYMCIVFMAHLGCSGAATSV